MRSGEADGDPTLASGYSALGNKYPGAGRCDAKAEPGELAIKDDMIATVGDLSINKRLSKTLGHRHPTGCGLGQSKGVLVYLA